VVPGDAGSDVDVPGRDASCTAGTKAALRGTSRAATRSSSVMAPVSPATDSADGTATLGTVSDGTSRSKSMVLPSDSSTENCRLPGDGAAAGRSHTIL
jgi:hypothetical protein